jgi:hypothetical protein
MENAPKAKPEDIREQYETQLKVLQEAYGEAMLDSVNRLLFRLLVSSGGKPQHQLSPTPNCQEFGDNVIRYA